MGYSHSEYFILAYLWFMLISIFVPTPTKAYRQACTTETPFLSMDFDKFQVYMKVEW